MKSLLTKNKTKTKGPKKAGLDTTESIHALLNRRRGKKEPHEQTNEESSDEAEDDGDMNDIHGATPSLATPSSAMPSSRLVHHHDLHPHVHPQPVLLFITVT